MAMNFSGASGSGVNWMGSGGTGGSGGFTAVYSDMPLSPCCSAKIKEQRGEQICSMCNKKAEVYKEQGIDWDKYQQMKREQEMLEILRQQQQKQQQYWNGNTIQSNVSFQSLSAAQAYYEQQRKIQQEQKKIQQEQYKRNAKLAGAFQFKRYKK